MSSQLKINFCIIDYTNLRLSHVLLCILSCLGPTLVVSILSAGCTNSFQYHRSILFIIKKKVKDYLPSLLSHNITILAYLKFWWSFSLNFCSFLIVILCFCVYCHPCLFPETGGWPLEDIISAALFLFWWSCSCSWQLCWPSSCTYSFIWRWILMDVTAVLVAWLQDMGETQR